MKCALGQGSSLYRKTMHARESVVALTCLLAALAGAVARAENNTTNILTGATHAGALYAVGNSGNLNYLEIRGPGGALTATNSVIGLAATATTNSATVTGSGARWISLDTFYVGLTGAVNRVTITNAGVVTNDTAYIGYDPNSRRNSALVTGANSRWHCESLLAVGGAGSDNTLTVSNSAVVYCAFDSLIGADETTAVNNAVLVTGTGSQWNSDNGLYVGYVGAGSRLNISSGGVVNSGSGMIGSFTSSNNVVTVTGANSAWRMAAGDLIIGDAESAGNQIIVTNGGLVTCLNAGFGSVDKAGQNAGVVAGVGSRWWVGDSLSVGEEGGFNQLLVQTGGVVTNADAFVGSSLSAGGNSVIVNGSGAAWTNRNLTVGAEGSGNSVVVQNGGVVHSRTNYIGFTADAGSNAVNVAGNGSRLVTAQSCYVGYGGCDNRLSIANGAQASHYSTWVGLTVDSCNNTLLLTDPNTVLTNGYALDIAFDGTSNRLIITNGAKAFSSFGRVSTYGYLTTALVTGTNSAWLNRGEFYVGQVGAGTRLTIEKGGVVSNFNGYAGVYNFDTSVLVTDPGSRWINAGDLYVNYGGSQHQLIVSNGAVVTNLNGYVGLSDASIGSDVRVMGAGSTWVNSRSLYFGFAGLDNILTIANGGTVRATNLVAGLFEDAANTRLSVADGNLIITNAANTARLDLQRGVLALTNGLVRSGYLLLGANAALTGTGTNIAVWVTNNGAIAPGNSAGRLNLHGSLAQRPGSVAQFELGGYSQGVSYDFLSVSNTASLGGALAVNFINGFESTITNNASFTLLTAASLSGTFANAPNGARLATTDGFADFIVSYSGGSVTLSQARVFPRLVVNPASLNIGTVSTGSSLTQAFQVVNVGGMTLTGSVSAVPPFAIVSGAMLNLNAGQTGQVMVSFSPGSTGSFSNAVVFTSNGGNSTNAVTGVGAPPPQLGVTPLTRHFGAVAVGGMTNLTFLITNSGGSLLTGTAAVSPGPFTILSGTPFNVAGFGSTNLVVRFAPVSAGAFTNAVVFSSNGGGATNSLSGVGAVPPTAQFSASPTNGFAPLTVSFNDTSTGTITNRFWQFGDGSTTNTTATFMTHAYAAPSTNTVTLTVSGPLGTHVLARSNLIVVSSNDFRIVAIQISGSNVIVRAKTLAGRSYQLERRNNVGSGVWSPVGGSLPGSGGVLDLPDTGGAGPTNRFYRVRESW